MGNSQPPPVDFDLIDSYARRRGDDIEIVLARPADSLASGSVAVRFSKAGATVHGSGFSADEGTIPRLILRAPRHEFTNGIWSMRLQPDHRSEETIGARLLVQGQRPLVLLWGERAPRSAVPVREYPRYSRQWAAAGAGRALDRALTVLPDQRARRVRQRVRKVARRVLS